MLDRPSSSVQPDLSSAWKAVADKLSAFDGLLLAVSGGPDSLAMLYGIAKLKAAGSLPADVLVVTVDHGLRQESADEATFVVGVCGALGFVHQTVRLTEKPDGVNLQAWARDERYRAFADAARAWKPAAKIAVIVAHTANDQAETVLMRAARGAGSEALAAIRPDTVIAGIPVLRPFLCWPRTHLHAVLPHDAEPVMDPSNTEQRFTRVRYRRWLGDSPVPDSSRSVAQGLAETARIAGLESDALTQEATKLFRVIDGAEQGYVLGRVALETVPLAISARFVRQVMLAVARAADAVQRLDMARMVDVAERLHSDSEGKCVLAGAVLEWSRDTCRGEVTIMAYAEAGRMGFGEINVDAGCTAIWDGRFEVLNDSQRTCTIRAWQSGDPLPAGAKVPKRILASLPVAVCRESVVATSGLAKGEVCLRPVG